MKRLFAVALAAVSIIGLAGCAPSDADGDFVVYVGRSETLIQPLIDQYVAETGVEVQVRYAGSAELAAQILEEGDNSPADVFMAQDAGALGAVSKAGYLRELDADLLNLIAPEYRAADGTWMGVSGRVRVFNYNPEKVLELPSSVLDLAGPEWKGRVGIAPTNSSFQAFVTALRLIEGDDVALAWLEAMKENGVIYEKNSAILEAVESGQVDAGLINHYYWYARGNEVGFENLNSEIAAFESQDVGNLRNVAGVGILSEDSRAKAFVQFLLSETAQQYFVTETSEYPLIQGLDPLPGLTPLDQIPAPEFDLNDLEALEETLQLIRAAGLI
ncbi:MAG: iron ABC transporter substrate-binding protein [Aquiluna sp.]|nr:iron ABC transporter substrate-binding protein [Aquiluna sp.]